MVKAELNEIEILELDSDDRGRINLKSKYGDKTVRVAVLGVEDAE